MRPVFLTIQGLVNAFSVYDLLMFVCARWFGGGRNKHSVTLDRMKIHSDVRAGNLILPKLSSDGGHYSQQALLLYFIYKEGRGSEISGALFIFQDFML